MAEESARFKTQAARLFTMAMEARDKGDVQTAETFTARAAQYLEQAAELERVAAPPPTSDASQQHVAQQQQRPQPNTENQ